MILIHTMAVKQWKLKEFFKFIFSLKPPIHKVRLVHGLMMWIRNSDYIYFLTVFAFVLKFLWASAHCTLRFLLQPVGLKVWNCILRCFAALSCTCWEWIFRTRLAALWPLITKMFPLCRTAPHWVFFPPHTVLNSRDICGWKSQEIHKPACLALTKSCFQSHSDVWCEH